MGSEITVSFIGFLIHSIAFNDIKVTECLYLNWNSIQLDSDNIMFGIEI